MKKKLIKTEDNIQITVINSAEKFIFDAQSALDLFMTILCNDGCSSIILNKEALIDDFFILSTGVAGEILQKVVNYKMKIVVTGDFSGYTSKPLKDFIYECNKGSDVFFVKDEEEAIKKLSAFI